MADFLGSYKGERYYLSHFPRGNHRIFFKKKKKSLIMNIYVIK